MVAKNALHYPELEIPQFPIYSKTAPLPGYGHIHGFALPLSSTPAKIYKLKKTIAHAHNVTNISNAVIPSNIYSFIINSYKVLVSKSSLCFLVPGSSVAVKSTALLFATLTP